jgi:outer membrane protein assembly factor BamB
VTVTNFAPVVANGIVYIGASTSLGEYRLYALHESNGTVLWSHFIPLASGGWDDSSGAVSGERLYITTSAGYVRAFYAANGTPIWNSSNLGQIEGGPKVAYGRVYVGSYSVTPGLYVLDEDTGATLLYVPTDGVRLTPAISGNKVIFATSYGAVPHLVSVNAFTGAVAWNISAPAGGFSTLIQPLVNNGLVYTGNGGGEYAFQESNGLLYWWANFTGGAGINYHALSGTRLFLRAALNVFYALNANTGSTLWSYSWGSLSSPVVSGGRVFLGGLGSYFALDEATGAVTWSRLSGSNSSGSTDPAAIANGRVYQNHGNFGGRVDAIGPASLDPVCAGPPIVELEEPAPGANVTSGTNTFSYVPYDDSGFSSATLYANFSGTFSAITANTSSVTNGATNYFSAIVPAGFFVWNVRACDDLGSCAFAPANFTLNSTPSP